MCHLIEEEEDRAQVRVYCQALSVEMQRHLRFLEDVLVLLRYDDESDNSFARRHVLVREWVDSVVSGVSALAANKSVVISCDYDTSPCYVEGVPSLLQQALQNLLTNAIKFSHRGGNVQVSTRSFGDRLEVCVRDEGIGFTPAQGEQIFERFSKAGRAGTQGEPSTGLGLYLVRKVVSQHGGTVRAHSNGVQQGAEFVIEMPLAASPQ
jgi:signal transduction histidine kinase